MIAARVAKRSTDKVVSIDQIVQRHVRSTCERHSERPNHSGACTNIFRFSCAPVILHTLHIDQTYSRFDVSTMNFHNPLLYDNVTQQNRRRAQTMQPTSFRGNFVEDRVVNPQFILEKYFDSQFKERANYANVGPPTESIVDDQHFQPRLNCYTSKSPHQHHMHLRSQSQHYYNAMANQTNDSNHHNNYYNLSNLGTTIIPARSRHPSPYNSHIPQHNHIPPLDPIVVMKICNELELHLDSAPPMPAPRNYSVIKSRDRSLYKMPFPQWRYVKGQFTDPLTRITLPAGAPIMVLHPAKDDRSKFTVCYNNLHLDIPHQLTAHSSRH